MTPDNLTGVIRNAIKTAHALTPEAVARVEAYYRKLAAKANIVVQAGFDVYPADLAQGNLLHDHQRDQIIWAARRGRALIASSFGLGKTRIQCELLRMAHKRTNKPVLIICPLGVRHQFTEEDGPALGLNFQYVRTDAEMEAATSPYLITNYERVRDGSLTAALLKEHIGAVSLDEGAILGNLGTKTQQEFTEIFSDTPYRWVATATPAPNDYRQLIYFADFLGEMDAGQALTRFFGRNPDKAGDLQLLPHMEREFWLWVASWALFVDKPSDLGYSDDGYVMPELEIRWHRLSADHQKAWDMTDNLGQHFLFKDTAASVTQAIREKRDSIQIRTCAMLEVVLQYLRNETFDMEMQNEDSQGTQSGILRNAQGSGEETLSGMVSREQGKDRQGETEKVHGGISQNVSTPGEDAGRDRGTQSEAPGTLCPRPGISGTREGTGDSQQQGASRTKTKWTPAGGVRDNATGLRCDSAATGREVRDLRSNGEPCESPAQTEIPLCGSRSHDREGARTALPQLQLRDRLFQGQPGESTPSSSLSRQIIIWCDLNDEQRAIEAMMKAQHISFSSIYGSLDPDEVERRLYEWLDRKTQVLICKPSMLGSGVNLQQCHRSIYLGLSFKFRNFVQSVHRILRYGQTQPVIIDMIHTDAEDHVVDVLMQKWEQHNALVARMKGIIQEYGLTSEALVAGMQRSIGITRQEVRGSYFTAVNNDTVIEAERLADNSIDEIVTSIPFGNHYEYVASLNDFGHNPSDADFWEQMDFLIPHLLRVLKPGRIAAIHVKDRLLYGHQNEWHTTAVWPFSDDCNRAFIKHGFIPFGRITVATDVVRENNSTNRLGWSENCKDGTKMGVGLPEYVLLFRKPQTDITRSYADEPVKKSKDDYSRMRWQIDAHAFWRSNGNRHLTPEEIIALEPERLKAMDTGSIYNWYQRFASTHAYDHEGHIALGETLNEAGKDRLPAKFGLFLPPAPETHEDRVWTNVLFMRTLNMANARRRQEKHVCPLPLDIVERLIVRYSNPGELVFDPFGGLFTVPYLAVKLGRTGYGCELNPDYWKFGVSYCQDAEETRNSPTLFDLLDADPDIDRDTYTDVDAEAIAA